LTGLVVLDIGANEKVPG